jgi:tRNA dimethylallyltransferase
LVGGTGFYIDIFTGRIKLTQISPDLKLRKSLESLPLGVLQNKLREIDNEVFESIDKLNKVRLVRALEKKLSANKDNDKKRLPYFDFYSVYIGLTSSRNVIYERVDKWVEKIWDLGLLDEVMDLRKKSYGETHRVKGLIYGTAGEFLDGKLTKKNAIERTKFDVHSYVRRQQTWFKRNPDIEWFDISRDDFEEIIYNIVEENIKNG